MEFFMLTQEELKKILSYDPDSGEFRWLIKGKNISIGRIAGNIKSTGYKRIMVKQKEYLCHRLAWLYMTGQWPKDLIDHIDGDGFNNKYKNLRECNNTLNQQNSKISKTNKTGIKGVDIKDGHYRARISVNGKRLDFGFFKDLELAEFVVSEARQKYHGEFARNR